MATKTEPRSVQFNTRLTPAQLARLEEIAVEKGFLGGPGLKPETPNLSLAARYLMGQADKVMADNDVSLEWDRNA